MQFETNKAIEILSRTPKSLFEMLHGLSVDWTSVNEGGDSWSVFDVMGHLIHGEKTDWIPRVRIILNQGKDLTFEPFDRFAQKEASKGTPLEDLLGEFDTLRSGNLKTLRSFSITDDKLNLRGIHPEFGEVTLAELLSTWVAHDLGHIAQISRVMAKQYKSEVGPWKSYLSILGYP